MHAALPSEETQLWGRCSWGQVDVASAALVCSEGTLVSQRHVGQLLLQILPLLSAWPFAL